MFAEDNSIEFVRTLISGLFVCRKWGFSFEGGEREDVGDGGDAQKLLFAEVLVNGDVAFFSGSVKPNGRQISVFWSLKVLLVKLGCEW